MDAEKRVDEWWMGKVKVHTTRSVHPHKPLPIFIVRNTMVNPGAFKGMRKQFLLSEKHTYALGVEGGYAADALANIQRRYFKRFPIDMPHNVEPTADFLAKVRDHEPEKEYELPDEDKLSAEDYTAAVLKLRERQKLIKFRKAQIKRWMAYQYTKDHDLDPKDSGKHNPYRLLLQKLTGSGMQRPRHRSACNIWRKTHREKIEHEARRILKDKGLNSKHLITARDQVAQSMFNALPKEERDQWEVQAKEDFEDRMAKWKADTEGPLSKDPADRQRCIQGIVRFMQPILDLLCEGTGFCATLMCGGPEPADGGRLNIISVHSGVTSGDIKMNFGRAERAMYKKFFVPTYGKFLQNVYTPEECRARQLPADEGFDTLAAIAEEEKINVDSVDFPDDSIPSSNHSGSSVEDTPPAAAASSYSSPAPPTQSQPTTIDSSSIPTTSNTTIPRLQPRDRPTTPPAPSPPVSPVMSPRSLPQATAAIGADNMASDRPRREPLLQQAVAVTDPLVSATPVSTAEEADTPMDVEESHVEAGNHIEDGGHVVEEGNHVIEEGNHVVGEGDHIVEEGTHVEGVNAARDVPNSNIEPGTAPSTSDVSPIVGEATAATVDAASSGNEAGSSSNARGKRGRETSSASPEPAPKCPRRDRSVSSTRTAVEPDLVIAPPDAPSWLESAIAMLQKEDLGDKWRDLLEDWTTFEQREEYKTIRILSSTHRPPCIQDWIRRARSATYRPDIPDVKQYGKDVERWWATLQPAWRRGRDGKIISDSFDGDWTALRRPGINGLYSVWAALFYWGINTEGNATARARWLRAVQDCHAVLLKLISLPDTA
ncbi:hypothetical protein NLJ89_g10871 [Agrocybe chaxingu]|uniref:Uncharacterized protein n=1 Tax=Agrocybe chaxingu TaxID=84603 RepID=A0A9W8MQH7_9AGAR|nr:hypothetical protein NLJ89_g10871 [Agrocybe chaxingu]